ncbi:hypothetical protein [uncultured Winogradskyella sp.]|uniref:hypothetical protein n=1 Tax=uncultured Winogradskyella sp. TaxID=395353 RepID=UPI003513A0E8
MKQNETIEQLFEQLEGKFDVSEPSKGHEARFLERLNNSKNQGSSIGQKSTPWQKYLAIAATIVLGFSLLMLVPNEPEVLDLASVSPELSETQDFFTVTLETELKKLNQERSPLTEEIINDALEQIEILEQDYQKLKSDLTESGKDQRVIYAMISNFQNRIDILNMVLEQIETIKQLKNNTNETTNTI